MSITLARGRRRIPDAMPVREHLAELRRRLLVTGVAVAAGCGAAFLAYPKILVVGHFEVARSPVAVTACT